MKKIKFISEKNQKYVLTMAVKYQASIMYEDRIAHLFQVEIPIRKKIKFSYKIHVESKNFYQAHIITN